MPLLPREEEPREAREDDVPLEGREEELREGNEELREGNEELREGNEELREGTEDPREKESWMFLNWSLKKPPRALPPLTVLKPLVVPPLKEFNEVDPVLPPILLNPPRTPS